MSIDYSKLQERYKLRALTVNHTSTFDSEMEMTMSLSGFEQLCNDYLYATLGDFAKEKSVEAIKISDDKYVVLRFDIRKTNLETAIKFGQMLEHLLPDKTVLLIPKEMFIECWGKEQLEAFKEFLEGTIHDLSFDNLVG